VRDSFFEGQHRIPSCFTSRTKHYDPARAETASVTSMWRQGKTGFWSVKLRPASARRAREDRRHSRWSPTSPDGVHMGPRSNLEVVTLPTNLVPAMDPAKPPRVGRQGG